MKCSYLIAEHPVYRFSMPVMDAGMYVVPGGESCLIVDPCVSEEAEALLREKGIRNCLVLLTHEHYDHISGVNRLRELLPCRVVCSEPCGERVRDPRKNNAAYFTALIARRPEAERRILQAYLDAGYACRADETYSGELEMRWEDLTLHMRETPGHSPGSQVIEIGRRWYFTGDSLIPGLEVITRLPGGSRRDFLAVTRPYLETIGPGSVLFPGHGEAALLTGRTLDFGGRS